MSSCNFDSYNTNGSTIKQQYLMVEKLHVLGADIKEDSISKVSTFLTINSAAREKESIKHAIYNNMILHVNIDPGKGSFSTIDGYESTEVSEINKWQNANTSYTNETIYSSQLKNIVYSESAFVLKSSNNATKFYEIPSNNILNFGVIYNKVSGNYEYCLIDEGNEKSFYTLESKLFTHSHFDIGSRPVWYLLNQEDSDRRGYFHGMIGDEVNVVAGKFE